jgi:hypothetical protein
VLSSTLLVRIPWPSSGDMNRFNRPLLLNFRDKVLEIFKRQLTKRRGTTRCRWLRKAQGLGGRPHRPLCRFCGCCQSRWPGSTTGYGKETLVAALPSYQKFERAANGIVSLARFSCRRNMPPQPLVNHFRWPFPLIRQTFAALPSMAEEQNGAGFGPCYGRSR